MSKSYRNQLVEWAYESLLELATEEECDERFSSSNQGWSVAVVGDRVEAVVSTVSPVMTLIGTLPLETLVNLLGPEVKNIEGQRNISCSGYSKLKPGDEWSGYEGYRICCKRAARDFANQILGPVDDKLSLSFRVIDAEEATIAELDEAFYTGNFGDLGLLEDGADEEE